MDQLFERHVLIKATRWLRAAFDEDYFLLVDYLLK